MTSPVRSPISSPKAPPLFHANGLADLRLHSAIRRHMAMVLEYCSGDITWAAEELGVDRTTVWRTLKNWEAARPRGMQQPPRPRKARLELVAGGRDG